MTDPYLTQSSPYQNTAFASNKVVALHRWVNWIAGFSAGFVQQALELHLPIPKPEQVVLDPFGGVGTTPITAFLRGHSVLSYEINPFPALVQRAKLDAISHRKKDALKRHMEAFGLHMMAGEPPQSRPPEGFSSRIPFYSERILIQVLRAWDYINKLDDPDIQSLFKVAFGATMVSFSNYSYEPSLGSRPAAGKPLIEDADVAGVLLAKLGEMYEDLCEIDFIPLPGQSYEVRQGSFMRSELPPESVDLVITSPPYLNNYHYLRNTRPQLYWLGFAKNPKDLRYLEEDNYGKFWQTVREPKYQAKLIFESPWLEELLAELAAVQTEKGIYGGAGWANYACEYFNDTYRFLTKMRNALKPGARALIVVGNSVIKGINIEVDRVFTHVAKLLGFTSGEIHLVRDARIGSSIVGTGLRSDGEKKQKLYEVVVELTR